MVFWFNIDDSIDKMSDPKVVVKNREFNDCRQYGNRNWLVVSNDGGNDGSICNIVPITSSDSKSYIPTHVVFTCKGKQLTVLCEQMMTVNCVQLQEYDYTVSDELMEKWLTKVYLEGKGGGNRHESYPLAWYFADCHIVTDAWEKRQQKGVLITIGDESCQKILLKEQLSKYLNDNPEEDLVSSKLLERVREKWNVFHIHCNGGSYRASQTNWEKLLGSNLVASVTNDGSDIKDIIPKLVVGCYRKPESDE